MRTVIVAALALSPMLLHAQARTPAPTSPQAPVLQSKLDAPAAFSGAASMDRSTKTSPAVPRISTGVVAPKLIHAVDIATDRDLLWRFSDANRIVVVQMTVDEAGNPRDLKIMKSTEPELNENVLTAVRQYRFKPGTVSGQPTAVPVTLEITVQSPYS
ncbi:MAG: TonB family protein [Acidobacteriaceae bacterium]